MPQMGKLRFKEAKGLPQGQLSRKWETRGGSLFTHLLVGSLKGSMTCRKGYVLSGIIQTVWLQTLVLVMCLDLNKYLTLLSLSVLSCQMGTGMSPFVGLLGGPAVMCSKAQSFLKTGILMFDSWLCLQHLQYAWHIVGAQYVSLEWMKEWMVE